MSNSLHLAEVEEDPYLPDRTVSSLAHMLQELVDTLVSESGTIARVAMLGSARNTMQYKVVLRLQRHF
jgi:hypothetical protein